MKIWVKGFGILFMMIVAILLVNTAITILKKSRDKSDGVLASAAIVMAAMALLVTITTIAMTPELHLLFLL